MFTWMINAVRELCLVFLLWLAELCGWTEAVEF